MTSLDHPLKASVVTTHPEIVACMYLRDVQVACGGRLGVLLSCAVPLRGGRLVAGSQLGHGWYVREVELLWCCCLMVFVPWLKVPAVVERL